MTQLASPPPHARPPRPEQAPPGVAEKLQGLRRRITMWFVLDGLSRLLWCAIALIAVDLVLDWTFMMDRAQRAVMLVLAFGTLAAVFYYKLIRPLSIHFSDDALCQQVEAKHAELGQSLISAVQFARLENIDDANVSPAMIRATIQEGGARASKVRFQDVLSESGWYRSIVLLVLAIVIFGLVGMTVASDEPMRIWFDRNIKLGDSLWPQDYYFEIAGVEDGVLTIPRGDDWPLLVTVVEGNEKLPPMDELNVQIDLRGKQERRFEKLEPDNEAYHYRLPLKNVLEEFRFQVRAGRSSSPWIMAKLIDRPEVRELKLEVTPPAYTGRETKPLPPGSGPYFVLKGSELKITGQASKPLSGATLSIGNLLLPLTLTGEDSFELKLPADKVTAGTYRINLLDKEKVQLPDKDEPGPLSSKRPTPFTLRTAVDSEPQVKVRLVGIGGMVVPGAKLPCEVRIRDDFAVRNVRLAYDWRNDANQGEQETQEIPLGEEIVGPPDQERADFTYDFEIGPLEIPTGSALKFVVQADDNDDISGPKTGSSTALLLRVVTEDELRADLLRREKEQRVEFEKILTQQDELYTESAAMLAGTKGQEEIPAEERGLLVKLQKRQKLLGVNIENVADRLSAVLLELQNNRLEEPNGPLQERLQSRIIDPLYRLATEAVPQAADQLDDTRRLYNKPAERDAMLADTVERQQAIAEEMRTILRHMVKSEGYQEAINLLYEIERQQAELLKLTEEERQERLKELLKKQDSVPEKSPSPEKKEPAEGDETSKEE